MPSVISPTDPRITQELPLNAMQRGFVAGVTHGKSRARVPTPLLFDVSTLPAGSTVLLTRQHGLGDVLMMTPLIRAMAQRGIHVDFATDPAYLSLLAGNPHIRSLFAAERGNWYDALAYDAVLDLDAADEHPAAEENNRIRHYGKCIGLDLATPLARRLDYFPAEEELEGARRHLSDNFLGDPLPRPWVAYVWESKSASRNWSKPTHEKAIRELLRAGASVIVLCGRARDGVPERPGVLNLCGMVRNLRRIGAILSVCDGVASPDTGLFHFAAALDKPILTYFGTFALPERTSGAETKLTMTNDAAARCCYAPCHEYECPFADVELQSPCVTLEAGRIAEWVKGLPAAQKAAPAAQKAAPAPEALPPSLPAPPPPAATAQSAAPVAEPVSPVSRKAVMPPKR